ncbi:MAG: mechanosensitive ion channel [Lentisphaeria bacterium]
MIWGVDIKNFGVFLSSVLGLVAIGFFAVWSILSNVLAGFFLFISDAFRIDDVITLLPEDISGTVKENKLMFVVLEDDSGDTLHVPNNLLIQKVIKRRGKNQ